MKRKIYLYDFVFPLENDSARPVFLPVYSGVQFLKLWQGRRSLIQFIPRRSTVSPFRGCKEEEKGTLVWGKERVKWNSLCMNGEKGRAPALNHWFRFLGFAFFVLFSYFVADFAFWGNETFAVYSPVPCLLRVNWYVLLLDCSFDSSVACFDSGCLLWFLNLLDWMKFWIPLLLAISGFLILMSD